MVLSLFSCKNQKEMKNEKPQIGTILYDYHDSSVPPQYHRSYSLLVTPDSIAVKVDSYGEILTDTAVAITKEQFAEIADTYTTLGMKQTNKREPDGCVGGTGASVKVWDVNDSVLIDGNIYFCGGEEYGTLQGDVKLLSQKIKSCIPDFEKLLKRD
jgi:hypothetical protein